MSGRRHFVCFGFLSCLEHKTGVNFMVTEGILRVRSASSEEAKWPTTV